MEGKKLGVGMIGLPRTGNLNVRFKSFMATKYLTAKEDVVIVKIKLQIGIEGLDHSKTVVQMMKVLTVLDLGHSSKNNKNLTNFVANTL